MTSHISNFRQNESGGVLLWILIAVALFAALSYAISGSSRGSQGMVSEERARLIAMEIFGFAQRVEHAVNRLLLSGCSETEISFGNDVYMNTNGTALLFPMDHNPNAPEDGRCHIFLPQGGGLHPYVVPAAAWGGIYRGLPDMAGLLVLAYRV